MTDSPRLSHCSRAPSPSPSKPRWRTDGGSFPSSLCVADSDQKSEQWCPLRRFWIASLSALLWGDPFYIEKSNSPARSRKSSTHISLLHQTRTIRMSRARGTTLGRRQGGQGRKLLLCRVPLQQPRRPLRRRDRAGQRLLPTIGSHTAEPKFASLVPFPLLFQQAWIASALAVPPRSPQRCLQPGSPDIHPCIGHQS